MDGNLCPARCNPTLHARAINTVSVFPHLQRRGSGTEHLKRVALSSAQHA